MTTTTSPSLHRSLSPITRETQTTPNGSEGVVWVRWLLADVALALGP
jgi:hypothetical protein